MKSLVYKDVVVLRRWLESEAENFGFIEPVLDCEQSLISAERQKRGKTFAHARDSKDTPREGSTAFSSVRVNFSRPFASHQNKTVRSLNKFVKVTSLQ